MEPAAQLANTTQRPRQRVGAARQGVDASRHASSEEAGRRDAGLITPWRGATEGEGPAKLFVSEAAVSREGWVHLSRCEDGAAGREPIAKPKRVQL